jgi:hypothetical protein
MLMRTRRSGTTREIPTPDVIVFEGNFLAAFRNGRSEAQLTIRKEIWWPFRRIHGTASEEEISSGEIEEGHDRALFEIR